MLDQNSHKTGLAKTGESPSRLTLCFWGLVAVVTVFRLVLSAKLGLGDDEAYYWDWSRFPALSYYDHPGMTAWLIHLSSLVFGPSNFSVRLPAVALNTGAWLLLWSFARGLFDETTALTVAFLYLLVPIFSLGGLMMVPDIPMSFCWICVMIVGWRTLNDETEEAAWGWLALGSLMGMGTLSKYTMVLSGVSLFIFLVLSPRLYRHLKTPWPWLSVVVWILASSPILVWNQAHDWASLGFQVSNRLAGQNSFSLARWGAFWASQIGLVTPVVFAFFVAAIVYAAKNWKDPRWRFLFCFSVPTLALFSYQASQTEFKPHWPAPAYLSLLIAAGFLFTKAPVPRRKLAALGVLIFVVPLNVIFYAETIYPLAPKIYKALKTQAPWNPQWDPTNDLYGWPEAAQRALSLQMKFTGKEGAPFLATHRYQLSSELAFASQEKVWTLSDGKDAYRFIEPFNDRGRLIGRDAIIVADNRYTDPLHAQGIFKSCRAEEPLEVKRGFETAHVFYFYYCRGFKGFPEKIEVSNK